MNSSIGEGSHRHRTDEQTCFFCLKSCKNWTAYQLPITEKSHPSLKNVYAIGTTQAYVMCYGCRDNKSDDEIVSAITEHVLIEERLLKKNNIPLDKIFQTEEGRNLTHGRQRFHRGKRK